MRIGVIGAGYVGLVTAACFAQSGTDVTVVEINPKRVRTLAEARIPYYEPGLAELVAECSSAGRIRFVSDYAAIADVDMVLVAVGTPPKADGSADMAYVSSALTSLAENHRGYRVIAIKSTVPVGTGDWATQLLVSHALIEGESFDVISMPEFLREGSALEDAQHPARVVIGSHSDRATAVAVELHRHLDTQMVITSRRSAEMIKYASNAFLATKISFANEMATVCERLGADIREVTRGMGLDPRVGPQFLAAGWGFGGSCFPKDVSALAHMAESVGHEPRILNAVLAVNKGQRESVVARLAALGAESLVGRKVAVLGLAFKPNTDDMREAPSITIVQQLLDAGAQVQVYDPIVGADGFPLSNEVSFAPSGLECLTGADAAVIVTEWKPIREMDWAAARKVMRCPVVLDGRNCLEMKAMMALGFQYGGIGLAIPGGARE